MAKDIFTLKFGATTQPDAKPKGKPKATAPPLAAANKQADAEAPPALEPTLPEKLIALSKQVKAGDAVALPRLRTMLDKHPEIWRKVGDLAVLVEDAWLRANAGSDPLVQESSRHNLAAMKAELLGKKPTCTERMLVDLIGTCWLEYHFLQERAADPGPASLQQARFRVRRIESAHKRYIQSLAALATVRSLAAAGRPKLKLLTVDDVPESQRA